MEKFTKLREIKPKYKVIFDNRTPYEVFYNTDSSLKTGLKLFYKSQDMNDYFNAKVFNDKNEDISESQYISEIVGEIISESEGD